MSRLNLSGQVRYADATPAAGARVTVTERDELPGGSHDKILVTTTDADGTFSGRSSEWQDREGTVLGVDLPDILQLTFAVTVDGKTHHGPLLLVGSHAAPILLPFGPPKPVSKAERELVQVILVSQDYVGAERALYQFIETSTEALTQTLLGASYRKITFLKGPAATLAGFASAVGAAAGSGVQAVDVLFTTHGSSDRMVFADGNRTASEVTAALLALAPATRKKFRAVFSTACFGATHRDSWLAAGFNDASGAEGIYADSAVSYAPFLAAWAAERTFAEAVNAANAADAFDLADNAARAYYTARGMRSQAAQVDSDRKRSGSGRTRIYTAP